MRIFAVIVATLGWRLGVIRTGWVLRVRRLLSLGIMAAWLGAAVGYIGVRRFLPVEDAVADE